MKITNLWIWPQNRVFSNYSFRPFKIRVCDIKIKGSCALLRSYKKPSSFEKNIKYNYKKKQNALLNWIVFNLFILFIFITIPHILEFAILSKDSYCLCFFGCFPIEHIHFKISIRFMFSFSILIKTCTCKTHSKFLKKYTINHMQPSPIPLFLLLDPVLLSNCCLFFRCRLT